jgi:hypothetical protein
MILLADQLNSRVPGHLPCPHATLHLLRTWLPLLFLLFMLIISLRLALLSLVELYLFNKCTLQRG